MIPEILILLALVLVNGLLSLAEIGIVSARRARLHKHVASGSARASAALALIEAPARFLATVRLGITLIAVTAGAFSTATLARSFAEYLVRWPAVAAYATPIASSLVVIAVALFTFVFGELVPRRIALGSPERSALAFARPLRALAQLVGPLVTLVVAATDKVLGLFGLGRAREATVSDEEVSLLIEQGLHEGVFHEAEKRMVEGVLALDRLAVTAIMTPRPKIVWLAADDPDEVNWRKIVTSGHSHFPVIRGSADNIIGMLSVKALWANSAAGFATPMRDLLVKPLYVSEKITGIQLLENFKRSSRHIALVTDEFGTVSGIVTLIDVLEAIVGDLPTRGQAPGPEARQRADGSWLIDATMPLAELKSVLHAASLPGEEGANYQTLGGFVMTNFGRIPMAGDVFESGGFRWEVVDMDHFRVDKVLVTRLAPAEETDETDVAEPGKNI